MSTPPRFPCESSRQRGRPLPFPVLITPFPAGPGQSADGSEQRCSASPPAKRQGIQVCGEWAGSGLGKRGRANNCSTGAGPVGERAGRRGRGRGRQVSWVGAQPYGGPPLNRLYCRKTVVGNSPSGSQPPPSTGNVLAPTLSSHFGTAVKFLSMVTSGANKFLSCAHCNPPKHPQGWSLPRPQYRWGG